MLRLYVYFQKAQGLQHPQPANSGVSIDKDYNTGELMFPNWQERNMPVFQRRNIKFDRS